MGVFLIQCRKHVRSTRNAVPAGPLGREYPMRG